MYAYLSGRCVRVLWSVCVFWSVCVCLRPARVCLWLVCVQSCIFYTAACSPKDYGSGLPLPSQRAAHFSALKPSPIPNYMRVKPGLPLLPPPHIRQQKSDKGKPEQKEKQNEHLD